MTVLGVDFDMHGISKAVAGMVADRNLEDSPARVDITAKDSQARATPGDLQLLGRDCRSGDSLNVLDHPRNLYASIFLDLLEQRLGCRPDLLGRFSQIRVNVGVGHRNRQAFSFGGTNPLEMKPHLRRRKANLLGVFLRQSRQSRCLKENVRVRCVLKDLFDVRQGLVQRTGARSSGLNQRSGSAPPFDKSFRLKHPQRFANRESTDSVPFAKNGFSRELPVAREFAAEYFFPKNLREFQISWLLLGISRNLSQQLSKLSLVASEPSRA